MKKRRKTKKNLDYYMSLKYQLEIVPIPEEGGGGFEARIPQLGRHTFTGSGNTIPEALETLDQVKQDYFERYLKEGVPIPEPEIEDEAAFSGKFIVRVPRYLHRQLVNEARRNGVSLNKYVNYLLAHNMQEDRFGSLGQSIQTIAESLRIVQTQIQAIDVRYGPPYTVTTGEITLTTGEITFDTGTEITSKEVRLASFKGKGPTFKKEVTA